ncbi:MAG: phospho-N-acetylmuramoyl-pentapeptide-transferase [Anaerolineae bacterium]|nr:phospho-N-acetylmuramoyl-pentapeptide-transferase [Anaerolineae bacterium]MDW8101877.1 phospho-N-acetylmuramoyl-pentapeptide-transferase [Anaerolineae bacterium]
MSYALALGTVSFLLAFIWGRPLIELLKKYGMGKMIKVDGPSSHMSKMGTPTMGGIMIIVPVLLITIMLNLFSLLGMTLLGRSILVPLGVMVGYGILGAIDDWEGIKGRRKGEGLRARVKFLGQVILAFFTALMIYYGLGLRVVAIPTVPRMIDLGLWYIPIAMFIIVGTSNAVNLTDGLDGLAGSVAAVAFAAYGVIAYLQGQIYLTRFCFTVVGALLAFLWYNSYPAELFMGDTGSLSIGATLAVVALMTGQWLLLPIIGFIFVAEVLSDIIQVAYFKYTKSRYGQGRRVFKMAPLHHHFELLGWSETHITQRFWLIAVLMAMLGIALALI